MDFKELKKLVDLVENAGISHLSIDENGTKIEIKKEISSSQTVTIPQVPMPVVPAATQVDSAEKPKALDENIIEIKAQMVGTFYSAASPDAAPFVKVGDKVSSGSVLCVIEAMKLFNEIECEHQGTIEEICVTNEQPVEFGQTLFLLRKG